MYNQKTVQQKESHPLINATDTLNSDYLKKSTVPKLRIVSKNRQILT